MITAKKPMIYSTIIIIFLILALPLIDVLTANGQIPSREKVLLIGHRGAGGLAPENTLIAIKKGLAEKADWVEIDIHQTKDNHIIVMHDGTVDRTTNGHGKIKDLTIAQIKELRIKDNGRFADTTVHVPLLTEVMEIVARSKARLIIEIKNPDDYPGMVKQLIAILEKQPSLNHFTVFSFDVAPVMEVKKALPAITTGVFSLGLESVSKYEKIDCDYICPLWNTMLFRPGFIKKVHQMNRKILVWTPDAKWAMKYLLKKNVDGIITNRPDLFNVIYGADSK